jgi:adenosylcobinamide-phosphate synthase
VGFEGLAALAPAAPLLLAGLALDAIFGDPQIRLHPIRLMGDTLTFFERLLRRAGLDGYAGGCVLFLMLAVTWALVPSLLLHALYVAYPPLGLAAHAVCVFIAFALRDLFDHVGKVRKAAAAGDLATAHRAVALFVGRDTHNMDLAACRRASLESLAESFVDGFLSPLFWYVLLGIPGLLVFKIVSTMDSMVGYRTPLYKRFGWCGARLDDVMNFVPARVSWILLGAAALPFPQLSSRKAWRTGLAQHAVVPGPNAGWSETTMAGLLQRRLVGPVWKNGILVTEVWLGDPSDPEGGSDRDVANALRVTLTGAVLATVAAAAVLAWLRS